MKPLIRVSSSKVFYFFILLVFGMCFYAVYLRQVGVLSNHKMFVSPRTEAEKRELLHSQKADRVRTDSKSMSSKFHFQNEDFMLFVPRGTELLKSKAGGTNEFLQYKDGTIFKRMQGPPRGPRECNFYKTVFDQENTKKDIQALREFVPCFMGEYRLKDNPKVTYLKLENVVSTFHKPCVMDIKMGKKIQEPEARPRRKVSKIQETYGFGITGMKVYSLLQNRTIHYKSTYLKLLYGDDFLSKGLLQFFSVNGKMRRDIIKVILEKTRAIETWFLTQRTFSIYSSSLLVVYDGDDEKTGSTLPCNWHSRQRPRCSVSTSTGNDSLSDFGQLTTTETSEWRLGRSRNDRGKADKSTNFHEEDRKKSRHNIYKRANIGMEINPIADVISAKQKNRTCKYVKADVRMIDFAHAFHTEFRDDNYLFGLSNFIKYLEQLLK